MVASEWHWFFNDFDGLQWTARMCLFHIWFGFSYILSGFEPCCNAAALVPMHYKYMYTCKSKGHRLNFLLLGRNAIHCLCYYLCVVSFFFVFSLNARKETHLLSSNQAITVTFIDNAMQCTFTSQMKAKGKPFF